MSMTNSAETNLLELYFNNTAHENIGTTAGIQGSSSAGSLYVGLTTGDPTETGSTSTECTYTGYARVAVARTSGGWTITGDTVDNTAAITFGEKTGGTDETAAYFIIATALTGGDVLFYGSLAGSLSITNGVIPEFAAGELNITVN